ncbi:MAG: hypothetical protein ACXAEU_19405, partial [Candidatus Hodarchaeales archaeon]
CLIEFIRQNQNILLAGLKMFDSWKVVLILNRKVIIRNRNKITSLEFKFEQLQKETGDSNGKKE